MKFARILDIDDRQLLVSVDEASEADQFKCVVRVRTLIGDRFFSVIMEGFETLDAAGRMVERFDGECARQAMSLLTEFAASFDKEGTRNESAPG